MHSNYIVEIDETTFIDAKKEGIVTGILSEPMAS